MLERQVGEVVINRIIESERPDFDAAQFFPTITPEQWAPYRQRLAGWAMDPAVNGLVFPMQSFLLRTRHHTVVVDTCVGDHKERARPNWNMTSSGGGCQRGRSPRAGAPAHRAAWHARAAESSRSRSSRRRAPSAAGRSRSRPGESSDPVGGFRSGPEGPTGRRARARPPHKVAAEQRDSARPRGTGCSLESIRPRP